MLLLVGGTGLLGSRVAERLADRGLPVRALVRPITDSAALVRLGFEVVLGDVRDPTSLDEAMADIDTVITTCTAMSGVLAGDPTVSIAEVDDEGNANLVDAAVRARVRRFVFVSEDRHELEADTPFTEAKLATEARLHDAPFTSVIVRPEAFQEAWLSRSSGFDPVNGTVRIHGEGRAPVPYVAVDDVAEAIVRLATMPDPPPEAVLAGPEAMSVEALVERWTELTGRAVRVERVPRPALAIGAWILRAFRPAQASSIGILLQVDEHPSGATDQGFRALGIEPRPVSAYLRELARAVPAA
jgi:uncharacterized protein YbjT (DUF2867 family)